MMAALHFLLLPMQSAARALSNGNMPAGPFDSASNGGWFDKEVKIPPAAGKKPHIGFILLDDYGWADAGWHRIDDHDPSPDVMTPNMNALVKDGIEMDRQYVYKYCSPTRSAIQSGRNPYHVNPLNAGPEIYNPQDPVSGMAAIPRNMTGMAMKMSAGGYETHMFGKWDAGMATPDHTPHGRGYSTSLHYFHHCNDYWTYTDGAPCNNSAGQLEKVVDLWQNNLDTPGEQGPAHGYNNTCHPDREGDQCSAHGPKSDHVYGGYEDALFAREVLQTVAEHDATKPYFLFWAPHIVHTPLEVPKPFFDKFEFMAASDKPTGERQTYHAMVDFADEAIGNWTAALKAKGMWKDTIVVFSADNGGPVYMNGSAGANNFPLKGGKMGNWEGGIRVNSWVSGGFLPTKVRGTKYEGLACGWDWYGTFSELAGIDMKDHRAAAAGLPPVDSHSLVPVLMGTGPSTRKEIPIGTEPRLMKLYGQPNQVSTIQGVIQEDEQGKLWKLLIGMVEMSGWQGPHYPNITTDTCCFGCRGTPPLENHCAPGADIKGMTDCTDGCLFEIRGDPLEHTELSQGMPEKVAALTRRIEELKQSAFTPVRCTGCDDGFGNIACGAQSCHDARACEVAMNSNGGFWGPFQE